MSLKTRFLLLAATLIVLASVAAWAAFQRIAEGIIEQWGQRTAELQVQYDSARLLQPLEREIALSRQLADSLVLRRWANAPDDRALRQQALQEMESFRRNFRSNSYFVALRDSGAYYHNNADNEFEGRELRYNLDPKDPADAWFYRLIEAGRDFHLNVNPDDELGVTKLWIDVLLRADDGRVLGIVGTGLDLEDFLRDTVDLSQPGITTLFVDYNGAIQLYRDQRLIDFATIVKPEGQKNTIDLLLDTPTDEARIQEMMLSLRQGDTGPATVRTNFVSVRGERHLAGIAYLPTIGWYEVTLLDLDTLMPVNRFAPVAAVFAAALLASLLVFHLAVQKQILGPIGVLESAMNRVRRGDLTPAALPSAPGEIGRLIQHFDSMAGAIRSQTSELERKVAERTEALHNLARIDPLTELSNRRGMTELIVETIARSTRDHHAFGVIWLDLDHFKSLNDSLGHSAGDRALTEVARLLRASLRDYDHAARWGGDEFLVLLSPCDARILGQIAERIRASIESDARSVGQPLTVSVGAYLARPGEDMERVLRRADEALYAAKAGGRNGLRIAGRAGTSRPPA
ncbi:hypothetical protein KBTX_01517 [wastewater metagenome]|uniref:Diguanylate cyclase n=2 Tax=unclassified sequences TaxID=12908 RepID=A0A5B8RB71_9ZZZZ|nr:diguanylate cyclase [Arhodomonas sp. KWT]QEA05198.1 hypothetical protein KBTEX_01517 [uncultured organism]